MQQQKSNRSIPIGVVVSVSTLIAVVGSSVAWWNWHSHNKSIPPVEPVITQPSKEPAIPPVTQQAVRVYWLQDTGNSAQLVSNLVRLKSDIGDRHLEVALKSLLAGPEDPAISTTIPVGTKLRSVRVDNNGIYVDLSREFTSGGGTTSMTGRLGQIVYTATTLQSDATVWISVEGEPLEYLGGGGLEVAQPITRQIFERDFSL